jgi:hypothetical protein
MSIIESLTKFLVYPQIQCRLTNQVAFIESLQDAGNVEYEEIISRFLTRFEKKLC